MTQQPELPPNYESLNEEELAQAKEEFRQLRERYERQKALEAEQRELIRKQWCEDQGFDE